MVPNSRGFTLVEALVTAGLMGITGLTAASMISNMSAAVRISAAQASNSSLASSLRAQLSRSTTCLPSLVTPPPNFGAGGEIAINLGAGSVARAGADLPGWKVVINSVTVGNFTAAGTLANGNQVYYGDILMQARDRDPSAGPPVTFRRILVARLAFEVSGGATVACYAANSLRDTTEQLNELCAMTTSSDGVAATWTGANCRIPDTTPATTCASMGGSWNGTSCSLRPRSFTVGGGADFGYPSGVWYPARCPSSAIATGSGCLSGSGPPPPLNSAIFGNAANCQWPYGWDSTQYVVWGACIQ